MQRAFGRIARLWGACVLALVVSGIAGHAQPRPGATPPQAPADAGLANDPLGRRTPRGTVLGFLAAARRGDHELARQYLDTRLAGNPADLLAQQLFAVLDARLPARLTELSDAPEGSRSNPLTPDEDLVGTISRDGGSLDIVVERVDRGKSGPIWLFSNTTLQSIPAVYEEIILSQSETIVPRFLTGTRVGGVRLFDWLAILLGIPALYFAAVLLDRLLTPLAGRMWRRFFRQSPVLRRHVLPTPARLLILALAGRWLLSGVSLSLAVRQFWFSAASVIGICSATWLLILLNGETEQYIRGRLPRANAAAAASLLRLVRRGVDLLVIFVGLLALLRLFAVDATPALAGLGVGGIAVALAAQKTLENVIAGASLIFDQAVRVGDFLKMGEVLGTVDHIGLRSTRIRTLDRTVVSIPNGQIANASLETVSARDKFWFHPVVGLRYETTPEQLRAVVDGIRRLLDRHPSIERESVRVRFIRLGQFSLDVEVFAYVYARDWNHFLEIQEQLLFAVTEIVSEAGTQIAFPSQTMYVAATQASTPAVGSIPTR